MSVRRSKGKSPSRTKNQRRAKTPAPWDLEGINKRAHEKTNRRLGQNRRQRTGNERSVWAAIAMEDSGAIYDDPGLGIGTRMLRWIIGLILLPIAWVTTWTLFKTFSEATLEQGFWQSSQFWYFAVGALVMTGWFASKILQSFFLYLYVFGHELTHAACVKCFGGKVLDMGWGAEGGYVTTDKTNWVIALSPYFVPFWSLIVVFAYVVTGFFVEMPVVANLTFYAALGASWTFHLTWTLWMIPKDQPDLTETGTFLSLIVIYVGNLLVLVTLLCAAAPHPFQSFKSFGVSWIGTFLTWGDFLMRGGKRVIEQIPSYL